MLLTADRRAVLTAELVGTAFLVAAVVGSGIAASRLSDDPGVQLLINAAATAGALVALIGSFGAVSSKFNPLVSLSDAVAGRISKADAVAESIVQLIGAVIGAICANVMFDADTVAWSTTARTGARTLTAEVIATVGLLVIIGLTATRRSEHLVAFTVAGYIAAGYFFTSSTSFANPAVTVARMMTDTYTGISPPSVPGFLGAQLVGWVISIGLLRVMLPPVEKPVVSSRT
jgi:glycerol uptake facilitator-like aquaporin